MIAVLVEAAVPRSAVPAGAKSAAMLVQGAWLVEIANIMWTGVLSGPVTRSILRSQGDSSSGSRSRTASGPV
jgi:hypothetical protein